MFKESIDKPLPWQQKEFVQKHCNSTILFLASYRKYLNCNLASIKKCSRVNIPQLNLLWTTETSLYYSYPLELHFLCIYRHFYCKP
ncbi:uncharacterized protein [Glycine max]|uniref:uncharacterized protein n=1 Tax=Glycine max TaxID=3847 RepID=UPI0003DEBD41|nr:uncharacterized protein LOC100820004 [Glycine max]|eukprot:XP_014620190.2 uncharacterized protein LOC100820004 [Glycine max]